MSVVGTWVYPDATAEDGYGHLGGWPGELQAESLELLGTEEIEPRYLLDGLTKVFGKQHLFVALDLAIKRAWSDSHDLCVVMLDLDHFKHFNHHFGHPAGDLILVELARLLSAHLRRDDVLARYGGEEFGCYPMHWGVDAEGRPTVLLVTFIFPPDQDAG